MGKYRFNPDKFAKKKKQDNNSNQRKADVQRTNAKNEDQTVINREDAKAPYNFVPLNKSVIEAEMPPNQDCYYSDRITGHIDCTLETLTPIYIRDSLTQEDLEQKGTIEKDGKKYINSDFFSPGKRLRIPGSSLRGMIRSLIEIGSYGKFSTEDKRLYFRAVADTSRLGSEYKNFMVDLMDNSYPKIKAGVLKYENQSYRIYPSKILPEGQNGSQIYRINFDKITKIVKATQNLVIPKFDFKNIYFKPVYPENHSHFMPNGKKHQLKYALLDSVSQTRNDQHPNKGFIIASGDFGKKKHMHWVINEHGKDYFEIDEKVIEEYRNDSAREAPNLLEILKQHQNGVPCFYISDGNNKILSFGHTGMFRLAYKLKISEHVPPELQDVSKIDMAEAIFGKEKDTCLFNWKEVPGNENIKFIKLFSHGFGIMGIKIENIKKSEDGKTITASTENNSILFELNVDDKKVLLKINDNKTYEFILKSENDRLNIYENSFSGRVFFEDAFLVNHNECPVMDVCTPETLSAPKPTTFQHYLKQGENCNSKNLRHYNDPDADLRGYKLYWHKSGENWKKLPENVNKNIDTEIKPVKKNTRFKFRIRFENLSRNELGALLFALKLPNESAHKLGMGKPLGLGSVKIKPELSISNRKKRYLSLFENEAWTLSENTNSEAEIDILINSFQKYILGKIGAENENASSLWETSRLKNLKLLLDVEIGKKLEKEGKIRYMSIDPNEFKYRKVLPTPENLINQTENTKSL